MTTALNHATSSTPLSGCMRLRARGRAGTRTGRAPSVGVRARLALARCAKRHSGGALDSRVGAHGSECRNHGSTSPAGSATAAQLRGKQEPVRQPSSLNPWPSHRSARPSESGEAAPWATPHDSAFAATGTIDHREIFALPGRSESPRRSRAGQPSPASSSSCSPPPCSPSLPCRPSSTESPRSPGPNPASRGSALGSCGTSDCSDTSTSAGSGPIVVALPATATRHAATALPLRQATGPRCQMTSALDEHRQSPPREPLAAPLRAMQHSASLLSGLSVLVRGGTARGWGLALPPPPRCDSKRRTRPESCVSSKRVGAGSFPSRVARTRGIANELAFAE